MMKHIILLLGLIIGVVSFSFGQTCNGSLSVTIDGSGTNLPLSATEVHTDLSCNSASGSPDGTITISPAGGTTPYTFDWADITGTDNDQNRIDLTPGSYSVTVVDANGCEIPLGPIVLTEPTPIEVTEVITPLACNSTSGAADGEIDITATGGTEAGTYDYNWATTDGSGLVATDEDQTGLSAGTYNVTITDDNNCTVTASYVLTEPTAVEVTENITQPSCNAASGAANGEIDITATGGTEAGTYDYSWATTDGSGLIATDEDQTGLSAGTYDVTITDDNNCTVTASYVLTEPTAVMCTATSPLVGNGGTNILCNGGTGSINVVGTGGSGTYTYSLDGGAFQTLGTFTGVGVGAHTVTIRDNAGCESTCDVTLTEPTPLVAGSCNFVQDLCQLGSGEIRIEASGGVAPYSVSWSATPVAPNTTAGDLDQPSPQTINTSGGFILFTGADGNNQYNFIVTDDNGCQVP